jgi:D-3-phosphoglycerate dehydrogenase
MSVDAAWQLSRHIHHARSVDELYKVCDYITIHVPATANTKGMIDKNAISLMKDGVVVLNFARDLLVDDDAMEAALASGKVRRYVTDFPNPTTAGQKGCIVIPHLGASTEESEDNCAKMAVKELMNYLENGNIINSVNYPACDMGICTKAGRVAVFHKNVANMITKFTACMGEAGINITDMTNKSRGEVAYTMIDMEEHPSEEILGKLRQIPGVFRVRVVK